MKYPLQFKYTYTLLHYTYYNLIFQILIELLAYQMTHSDFLSQSSFTLILSTLPLRISN